MPEKLVIKNLGPIKDAEIDLRKLNIFIGPQGSGKSTIAKVLSAVISDRKHRLAGHGNDRLKEKLIDELNLQSYFGRDTSILIKSNAGNNSLVDGDLNTFVVAEPAAIYHSFPSTMYVPAERTVIPLIAGSSFLFIREKTPIPRYVTDFGLLFQKARSDIKSQQFEFLDNVVYHYRDGRDMLELKNGKFIDLIESSNGMQSTIPLLLALSWLTARVGSRSEQDIYLSIEEPELSLFPYTQFELLKFILERIKSLDYHLTITTHSPYTLTAINNLIYAWQVGQQHPETESVVPKELWLNPADVGAWYVDQGKVRSIIDPVTLQIKAEEIDKVSEALNHEYDQLMDLKFK